MEGYKRRKERVRTALHFLLRKKQIPAPYPINIRNFKKKQPAA
jgi:hypothetical protein